jgi:hypothetical protein
MGNAMQIQSRDFESMRGVNRHAEFNSGACHGGAGGAD